MKYVDEYRSKRAAERYAAAISDAVSGNWTLMEICGGQTNCIVKYGLDTLLPGKIRLIHGPGCPVCVTPVKLIDTAASLSRIPEVILCSFGDMLRVPGTEGDLLSARASGGDVKMVYSPLDAVDLAIANPDRQVVFFAVGFETTVPVTAMAVRKAHSRGVSNFTLLVAHVRVPPVIRVILSSPDNGINGFLAAGHVCAVTGYRDYEELANEFSVPFTVTGFEPLDILQGILMTLRQLESGKSVVENQYSRVVNRESGKAWQIAQSVFEFSDMEWRGLGMVEEGGFRIRDAFREYDAMNRFTVDEPVATGETPCRSGEVLMGLITPESCESFGTECTPENPLGAPMVSSEGACAAYYRYRGGGNG